MRFLLELCLVGALAAGGWMLGDGGVGGGLLAAGFGLAAAAAWGAWIGPRSRRRLRDPARLALELVLFILGGACLWAAWAAWAGLAFAAASALVAVATRVVGEPVAPARQ